MAVHNKIKLDKGFKALCIIILIFLTSYFVIKLVPYKELEKLLVQEYSYSFYDCNNKLLQVTSLDDGLKREFTPVSEIPSEVQRIFIKAEDSRFYHHSGIDIKSIIAAGIQNNQAGKTVRGASTIPMQLAKIIDSHNTEQIKNISPINKKLRDCLNAIRIETKLSKKQILQLYLNNVPFGMNIEGVTSAARSFFGCELNNLSQEQICVLAVIPRSPTQNNPARNPDNAKERALNLYNSLYDGIYGNKENEDINALKISDAVDAAKLFEYPFEMPHYINYLKKNLSRKNEKNHKTDSFKIITKTDYELYQQANQILCSVSKDARNSRINNSALLILDNSDGSVLTWIGNTDFFDSANNGQIDGVLALNQMGSSMKPFLYGYALEYKGENNKISYYPSKILFDIPTEFGNEQLYIPSNFNNRFNGPIRFRVALASSLNIPAVSILNDIGVNNYLNKLYELGFDSLKIDDNGIRADLGLALGAGEVSLLELTRAFSVFTNDGELIINEPGKEISKKSVYNSDTARIMCSILSDKASRALGFGYNQTFETDYPAIFKTGTSNQYQNIVALGATKNYTVGVWMGNFNGETVIGKTGSSLPAYAAKKVLDYLENGKNISELKFEEPENWKREKICSLSGMKASPYCQATVYEYIQNDFSATECNWHKIENNRIITVYPNEYDSELKINTPKNNSVFYFSQMDKNNQAIPVEVVGGKSDLIEVYYDDVFYQTVSKPFNFNLPVEKGKHRCSVVCQNDQQTIVYEVR